MYHYNLFYTFFFICTKCSATHFTTPTTPKPNLKSTFYYRVTLKKFIPPSERHKRKIHGIIERFPQSFLRLLPVNSLPSR